MGAHFNMDKMYIYNQTEHNNLRRQTTQKTKHPLVDPMNVFHHQSPQELEDVGETCKRLLQDVHMVATLVQQGHNDSEESIKVRVKVTLQVPCQLDDQAGEKWLMSINTL